MQYPYSCHCWGDPVSMISGSDCTFSSCLPKRDGSTACISLKRPNVMKQNWWTLATICLSTKYITISIVIVINDAHGVNLTWCKLCPQKKKKRVPSFSILYMKQIRHLVQLVRQLHYNASQRRCSDRRDHYSAANKKTKFRIMWNTHSTDIKTSDVVGRKKWNEAEVTVRIKSLGILVTHDIDVMWDNQRILHTTIMVNKHAAQNDC